jgi:hypothetical protein
VKDRLEDHFPGAHGEAVSHHALGDTASELTEGVHCYTQQQQNARAVIDGKSR